MQQNMTPSQQLAWDSSETEFDDAASVMNALRSVYLGLFDVL